MSLGGRHGHTIRRLRRRMDAVLEEDRIRRGPIPPPISEEHAAMRERIERAVGAMYEKVAKALEGKDLDEAVREDPELAFEEACMEDPEIGNDAATCIAMAREESAFLASQGVDPRLYQRHEPKF
jgi:hypothetical protein